MGCFVVAEFLLTSASRGPSAIAEPLVHIMDPTTCCVFLIGEKTAECRNCKIAVIFAVSYITRTRMSVCACCCQGFGVAAKSTSECRHVDPMTLVVFHQADIGEYIRTEMTLT